jgi:hypothetical protein
MNAEPFTAFFLITMVLILTPGPNAVARIVRRQPGSGRYDADWR